MCNKEYNGWVNYETWAVNLWLDGLMVEDLIGDPDEYDDDHDLTYAVSQSLKDYVEELDPLADDASLFADLLHAALQECNWYEIAEHYVEDYRYEHPTKQEGPAEYQITLKSNGYFVQSQDHSMLGYTESTFWKAFNEAIDDAYTDGNSSLVITWNLDPSVKADRLIQQQAKRNTKK